MSVVLAVGAHIPSLRRFARALTGSQMSGDAYVSETLQAFLADQSLIRNEADAKASLFKLLLAMWNAVDANRRGSQSSHKIAPLYDLQEIAPKSRQAFLLTGLEGFSVRDAARIMLISCEDCGALLDEASRDIAFQLSYDVMIIEDEPLIAWELADIVADMGHTVRHIVHTHRQAIAAVKVRRPQLVLADLRLADGSSGLSAVNEILRSIAVPIIFITAFPELLLTGRKPEPTYLVEKPFRAETVRALISQAVFLGSGWQGHYAETSKSPMSPYIGGQTVVSPKVGASA